MALVEVKFGTGPLGKEWVFCFYKGSETPMIISMKLHSTKEEIAQVKARIEEFGYKVHSIEGEERVVIGAVGMGDVTACLESLEAMPQVEKAVRISAPYKFVSREFRPAKTEIKVAGVTIGGDEFVVMAGPCSVESEQQILESAEIVARAGAKAAARRRVQAAHFALRFPGPGAGRAEAAGQSPARHRPRHHHRSDERPRRRSWSPNTPTSCRSARATCRTSRCSRRWANAAGRSC